VAGEVLNRAAGAVVRAASRLVPRGERARWVQEWQAELEHRSRGEGAGVSGAMGNLRRSLGAVRHALFLLEEALSWDALSQDLRHAARAPGRRPGPIAAAVLTLAVGIGASTAFFSVLDAVLLRPLPYPRSGEIAAVFETQEGTGGRHSTSPGNVLDWRRASRSFTAMGAFWIESTTLLSDVSEAEEVPSALVTVDFFPALGVQALLGRTFSPNEVASEERVTVLSYELWQRRFGGAFDVIGRDVRFKDGSRRIIGVMPRSFRAPGSRPGEVQLFKPWDFESNYKALPAVPRDWRFATTVARLGPDVSIQQAQTELASVASGLADRYPDTNRGWGVEVVPLQQALSGDVAPALFVLGGAVGFVLLLACANVGGLLLVRTSLRGRELAVRTALGASRARLARLVLVESLLLSLLGGSLGSLLAWIGTGALVRFDPGGIFRLEEARVDARALGFALAVSLFAGLVSGLTPALKSTRSTPIETLKSAGGTTASFDRRRRRFGGALVVAEIAAAVVLLVGSALLLRSFATLLSVDPGFDPANLLVVRMRLDGEKYKGKAHLYYSELLSKLRSLPGVDAASGVTALPMDDVDIEFDRPYWRDGEPRPKGGGPGVHVRMSTVGYFETMRIPLLGGRLFDEADDRTRPRVVIVNQTLAQRTWPGESPVGKRIRMDYQDYEVPYEVVGVVGDTRFAGLRSDPAPEVYIPHAQNPYLPLNLVLRTNGDPLVVAAAARETVLSIDRNQPVHSMQAMSELVGRDVGRDSFTALVMTSFGAVALLLAGIGLYGVVAQSVTARQRELGLRMALGADRGRIVSLVLGEGFRLALAGGVLGLGVAILVGRSLEVLLFRVRSADPPSLATAVAITMATVLLASYLPARRAAGIDPTKTLHSE
jgi:putative ABC transport system permease protein